MKTCLGIEFGSTRIKAVAIDDGFRPVSSGDYTWASRYENGVWTYPLEEVWTGLKSALSQVEDRDGIAAAGVSAMMHGYLAFDRDWNLLVPFRTWQNTITGPAAAELTELFGFNIPQRWSIAHLYQAILNGEPHVPQIAHLTTLAGYIHHQLTGVHAVGVGEASGIFPIDSRTLDYDAGMLEKFNSLIASRGLPWRLEDLLPKVLTAGQDAGVLTQSGARLLDGLLPAGIPFAPAEGDAGTGMVATNAVAPRTGNVSAGTSIFSMVVLERPLSQLHEEIDLVTTPTGAPVAMVHCNNCTNEINAWAGVFRGFLEALGQKAEMGEIYTALFRAALSGEKDCGGLLLYNYLSGEPVAGLSDGRPLLVRGPSATLDFGNFARVQLYSALATLKIGLDILAGEQVAVDRLMGHGGFFKTPEVGQRMMAAAANAPVSVMETAGEGGPWGMAILAAYLMDRSQGQTLEDYLENRVFAGQAGITLEPDPADVEGFDAFMKQYAAGLALQRAAVEHIKE